MDNIGYAVLIARWILGVLFFMAGWWKVFVLTPFGHAQRYFITGFSETWIPDWLLWTLGTTIPIVELAAGTLLFVGWRVRDVLVVLGVLLIITTYGHALQEPLFDIDGHTFTRLALILFLLSIPIESDRFTLDAWLRRK